MDVASLAAPAAAAFTLALAGGLHCAGMCGGFVGALGAGPRRARPVVPIAAVGVRPVVDGERAYGRILAYHAGRVVSYSAAGALAGAIGATLFASQVLPLQLALLSLASLMLLAIGLVLFGRTGWLRRLEPVGLAVWSIVGPLARRLYPPRNPVHALAAGLAWGWIPCGMVYGALPLALGTASVTGGATVMLAFGIGTLPNLLAMHWLTDRLAPMTGRLQAGGAARLNTAARAMAGATIIAFGVSGFAHVARVAGADHPAIEALASLCHAPVR